MKHFILLILFGFFIVINADVKVEEKQTLNEYKIEQQQKSIDELKAEIKELKKEIDDTKEKKLENKAENKSLGDRIGDINGNVDRFGILVTIFGVLITAILFGLGFVAYRNAKSDAKEEAEKITKYWIEKEGNNQLENIVNKLEEEARQKIEEAVKTAKDEIKLQSKSEELIMQGNSHYYNKEYKKAEKYYLEAIKAGNNNALNYLGVLYKEQKDYEKAEKYFLEAIKDRDNDALFNLGLLYDESKKYEKAEKCYFEAIEAGDNDALNNLAYLYFSQLKNKEKALELIMKSYNTNRDYINTHTLATILLWNEEFSKSYEKYEEWMEFEGALESLNDISEYLNLLIAKGQYSKAKEYFENEKYQLKDKLKPIWYALMTLMQDEFPNEIKKMGSELQESVDDILKTIEELNQKYKI